MGEPKTCLQQPLRADTLLTRIGWFTKQHFASSNQSRTSKHLLPRSGAELSSLTGLRVSCVHTHVLNMKDPLCCCWSLKNQHEGKQNSPEAAPPRVRPTRRTTPRTPELRVCLSLLVRSTRLLLHTRLGGPSGQSFSRSASPLRRRSTSTKPGSAYSSRP